MQISDILSTIGIVFAIVALISENDRRLVLLKFSRIDYALLIIAFLLINYLVLFDFFYGIGWYLNSLMIENAPMANHHAYFILLAVLTFICIKVFIARFSSTRDEDVLNFYQNLLTKEENTFLFNLILRFHRQDIIEFLDRERAEQGDGNHDAEE